MIMNTIKLVIAIAILSFLSACGGGGGSSPVNDAIYGAIATQTTQTGVVFVSSKYTTQSLANSAAINGCVAAAVIPISCSVRIQFVGTTQCGAVSRGSNYTIGYASGNSIPNAESNAVANCKSNGGIECVSVSSACN